MIKKPLTITKVQFMTVGINDDKEIVSSGIQEVEYRGKKTQAWVQNRLPENSILAGIEYSKKLYVMDDDLFFENAKESGVK